MRTTLLALALSATLLLADQSLKSALDLTMDQARQVDRIQAGYRPRFAAKRQERNTELRKLRRARLANDSVQVAALEKTTAAMLEELRQIRAAEDEAIRKLLTPEQEKKFEAHRKLRKEMVGSSRDDKEL
jgi:Spy/CpxP family protein refolding chaperone